MLDSPGILSCSYCFPILTLLIIFCRRVIMTISTGRCERFHEVSMSLSIISRARSLCCNDHYRVNDNHLPLYLDATQFCVLPLQCSSLYRTLLYCTLPHCNVLHRTVLNCTVLNCTLLYTTVLYSSKL